MRLIRAVERRQAWGVAYRDRGDGLVDVVPRQVAGEPGGWVNCANVVVHGALRPVRAGHLGRIVVEDGATGMRFTTVGAGTLAVVRGLIDGTLHGRDGCAVGQWTFVNRAGDIFIQPFVGDLPPEAPPGVPDLTDFVRAMALGG